MQTLRAILERTSDYASIKDMWMQAGFHDSLLHRHAKYLGVRMTPRKRGMPGSTWILSSDGL
jgi:hypothetical protein